MQRHNQQQRNRESKTDSKDASSYQHFPMVPNTTACQQAAISAQQRQPDENDVGNREWGPYNKQLHGSSSSNKSKHELEYWTFYHQQGK